MPRLLILLLAACIVYTQHNTKEATRILEKKIGKYSKHGWNHYGPGHFTLDSKTGVLKSHGGMGLFWYSEKNIRILFWNWIIKHPNLKQIQAYFSGFRIFL